MNVYINESRLKERYHALEKSFVKIKGSNAGAYGVLRETVIERFLLYGKEDIDNGQYERAVYVCRCLEEMKEQLQNSANDGWRPAFSAARPVIDGYSFRGADKKPVFYCGYGHFEQVKKDIPLMNRLGCNSIQIEIGPSFLLYPKGTHDRWNMADEEVFAEGEKTIYTDGDFEVNLSVVKKDMIPALDRAKAHGVSVCLLLSPHYVPGWMFGAYPGFRSKNVGFFKYNIYHPKAKEMLTAFIRAVVPLVKDCPALQSICISNEPTFNTISDTKNHGGAQHALLPTAEREAAGVGYLSQWHAHLHTRFADICTLNSALHTSYVDFQEIDMPDEDEGTPLFYEWFLFNNRMFADWHAWLADTVRSFAPEIPIQAKFMPVFGTSELPYHRRFIHYGVDPALFAEFTDISGNDAWSFEGKSHLPLSYKLSWYDYLSSLKKMPIQNSEDHVIEDREQDYSPIQAKRIYADLWQGAVHGRSASEIWVWERSNMPQASANGGILHRPDCVEAVGCAALDLNRLSSQVAAMQNCDRPVAVLYSNATRIYSLEYTADLFKAYEGILYAGFRPYYLTEEKIGRLNEFLLLVVPCVTHTHAGVLAEILSFLEQGGKVLMIDRKGECLSKNEYDKGANGEILQEIRRLSTVIEADESTVSPNGDFSNIVTQSVAKLLPPEIEVLDENGDSYNIEWCAAAYEGRTLINICSYDGTKNRSVRIFHGTKELNHMTDLISGVQVTGVLELTPYRPMLLYTAGGSYEI